MNKNKRASQQFIRWQQKKRIHKYLNDQLQPWKDQPGTIPKHLLQDTDILFQQRSKMIKRFQSMQTPLNQIVKISQRQSIKRISKELPVNNMNLQTLTPKKYKQRNKIKNQNIIDKDDQQQDQIKKIQRRKSQNMLPNIKAVRSLAVQRSIFLLKHKYTNSFKYFDKIGQSYRRKVSLKGSNNKIRDIIQQEYQVK